MFQLHKYFLGCSVPVITVAILKFHYMFCQKKSSSWLHDSTVDSMTQQLTPLLYRWLHDSTIDFMSDIIVHVSDLNDTVLIPGSTVLICSCFVWYDMIEWIRWCWWESIPGLSPGRRDSQPLHRGYAINLFALLTVISTIPIFLCIYFCVFCIACYAFEFLTMMDIEETSNVIHSGTPGIHAGMSSCLFPDRADRGLRVDLGWDLTKKLVERPTYLIYNSWKYACIIDPLKDSF